MINRQYPGLETHQEILCFLLLLNYMATTTRHNIRTRGRVRASSAPPTPSRDGDDLELPTPAPSTPPGSLSDELARGPGKGSF